MRANILYDTAYTSPPSPTRTVYPSKVEPPPTSSVVNEGSERLPGGRQFVETCPARFFQFFRIMSITRA